MTLKIKILYSDVKQCYITAIKINRRYHIWWHKLSLFLISFPPSLPLPPSTLLTVLFLFLLWYLLGIICQVEHIPQHTRVIGLILFVFKHFTETLILFNQHFVEIKEKVWERKLTFIRRFMCRHSLWSLFLPMRDSPRKDFPQSVLNENCSGNLYSQKEVEEESEPKSSEVCLEPMCALFTQTAFGIVQPYYTNERIVSNYLQDFLKTIKLAMVPTFASTSSLVKSLDLLRICNYYLIRWSIWECLSSPWTILE